MDVSWPINLLFSSMGNLYLHIARLRIEARVFRYIGDYMVIVERESEYGFYFKRSLTSRGIYLMYTR